MRNSNKMHVLPSSNLSCKRTLADCTCEMLMTISQGKKNATDLSYAKKCDMVSCMTPINTTVWDISYNEKNLSLFALLKFLSWSRVQGEVGRQSFIWPLYMEHYVTGKKWKNYKAIWFHQTITTKTCLSTLLLPGACSGAPHFPTDQHLKHSAEFWVITTLWRLFKRLRKPGSPTSQVYYLSWDKNPGRIRLLSLLLVP